MLVQRASAGQVGSPPPDTVAVLVTLGVAAAVGVTGITNEVLPPAARPAATVQVTVWPAAEQPAGSVPIVRPVGIVSVIVDTAVVAAVPVLLNRSVYEAGTPTVKLAAEAVLVRVSCGASTGVGPAVLVQRASAGQVGSPPPETVAVLVTLGVAASVGVTGITNEVLPPAARPAATVQVTVWPAAEQPAGSVPMVRPAGIVSVIVDTAVVAAVPVLLSCSVYDAGTPTTKLAAEAVLVRVSCGASTGVGPTEAVQRAAAGQPGSPPPLTVAVLVRPGCSTWVGVTGITNEVLPPDARPVGMVQVTVWPAAEQPAGSVPMVRLAGMVSVMVATARVGARPLLLTVSVYDAGTPTTHWPALAVFVRVSSGAWIGVGPAVLVQRASAGQVGSPPPDTVAVLVTFGIAAAVGVTGITNEVLPPAARPAATVQVTV